MNLSQLERIVMVAKSGNITDVAQKTLHFPAGVKSNHLHRGG